MSNISKRLLITVIIIILFNYTALGQKQYKTAAVAFYNVENLYDTISSAGYIDGTLSYLDANYHTSIPTSKIPDYDTVRFKRAYTYENIKGKKIIRPIILQEEYSENSAKVWDGIKYKQKIANLASVLSEMGRDVTQSAPVIIGLAEVENRNVIEDLINHPKLKPYHYDIIHYNSFDARGIDVALIYQKNRFQVLDSKPYVLKLYDKDDKRKYTRDILSVTGLLDGEKISFLVNHWPSRSGGEKASMPYRIAAAKLMKEIFDTLKAVDINAKIIAMGDFNDDPVSTSIRKTFQPKGNVKEMENEDYYNPMLPLFKKGLGTLAYRDSWNLFDQFITSGNLAGTDYSSYKIKKTIIFNPNYLIEKDGAYKGYPKRTYAGNRYSEDGYSDHFPIYTILIRKVGY